MDPNQVENNQYASDQKLQNEHKIQVIKEGLYRFFYNIWPSVNRVLNFFFYHIFRIVRGFFKMAMEQLGRR